MEKSRRRTVGVYHDLEKTERHLEIERHFKAQKKRVFVLIRGHESREGLVTNDNRDKLSLCLSI